MFMRKSVLTLALLAGIAIPINQSRAEPALPVAMPAAYPYALAWGAGTIIGLAAFLCAVDFVRKLAGEKNWDGTEKVHVRVHHRHHHHG